MQTDPIRVLDRSEIMPDVPLRVFHFRQPNDVLHVHNFHELVLVRRGSGIHLTEGGEFPIRRGDVFLIRPGVMHTYCNVNGLEIANMLFIPHSERGGIQLTESGMRRAEELIGAMVLEQQRRTPGWKYFVRLHFMTLLGLVCRTCPEEPEAVEGEFERLSRVVNYIESHYAEPITLETLAALGGCSKSTLIRLFRHAFASTPIGYLLEFRLEHGREQLEKSALPISEIALRNGFPDSNYFTKLFHRRYGRSPREHRRLNRAAADR